MVAALVIDDVDAAPTTKQGSNTVKHQSNDCSGMFATSLRSLGDGPAANGIKLSFPQKLHKMLKQIERDGHSHIVSWKPHGRCFVIHDQKAFVDYVLPTYFCQTQFASFQRQLNRYGFSRMTSGGDNGCYYHELFLRHQKPIFLHRNHWRTMRNGARLPEESEFDSIPPVTERSHASSFSPPKTPTCESIIAYSHPPSPTNALTPDFQLQEAGLETSPLYLSSPASVSTLDSHQMAAADLESRRTELASSQDMPKKQLPLCCNLHPVPLRTSLLSLGSKMPSPTPALSPDFQLQEAGLETSPLYLPSPASASTLDSHQMAAADPESTRTELTSSQGTQTEQLPLCCNLHSVPLRTSLLSLGSQLPTAAELTCSQETLEEQPLMFDKLQPVPLRCHDKPNHDCHVILSDEEEDYDDEFDDTLGTLADIPIEIEENFLKLSDNAILGAALEQQLTD